MVRARTVVFGCVLGAAAVATASNTSVTLHTARLALASYEAESTLEAIGDLGSLVESATDAADQREATFLRAVAATDLLLIARQRDDQAMATSIASAYGVEPPALITRLGQDLATLSRGVYGPVASDAAKTVTLLGKTEPVVLSDLQRWNGTRRDLFMLALLRSALTGGNDALSALQAFASDPCADSKQTCPLPYAPFAAPGRQAIAALSELARILERLDKTARDGDPLAQALREDVARITDSFVGITLRPAPKLDGAWQLTEASGRGLGSRVDLVVTIGTDQARYGFVPFVRLNAGAEIEVTGAGTPLISSPASVPLPTTYAGWIRAITELEEPLHEALANTPNAVVAFGADPETPGHVVARALHSIRAAGGNPAWLLARTATGETQAVPLEVATTTDQTKPAAVSVRVRLGGYTVSMGAREEDIPRVKVEDVWYFDVAALDAALAGRARPTAEVSFMGDLAAQYLVEAAFHVAPENNAVRLVIP